MTPSPAGRGRKHRDEFVEYVAGQLAGLGDVAVRGMFGGHGISSAARFFGIIDDGEVFLRTDDAARPDFIARGMTPFEPWPGHVMNGYWRVPPDVIEDAETFVAWARRAVAASPAKRARRPKAQNSAVQRKRRRSDGVVQRRPKGAT